MMLHYCVNSLSLHAHTIWKIFGWMSISIMWFRFFFEWMYISICISLSVNIKLIQSISVDKVHMIKMYYKDIINCCYISVSWLMVVWAPTYWWMEVRLPCYRGLRLGSLWVDNQRYTRTYTPCHALFELFTFKQA